MFCFTLIRNVESALYFLILLVVICQVSETYTVISNTFNRKDKTAASLTKALFVFKILN